MIVDYFNTLPERVKFAILAIAGMFVVIFAIILIVRLILSITLFFLIRKYLKYKQDKKTKKYTFSSQSNNEIMERDKDKEIATVQKQEMVELYDELEGVERFGELEEQPIIQEGKIVDIAKPIGFWTSLVLGEKLGNLVNQAHNLSNRDHKGFWVAMLETRARGGRQQQRGL